MQGKKVCETTVVMVRTMSIQDANAAGNVHGGGIMKLIDMAGGTASLPDKRGTASVDRLNFLHPVYIGDVLSLRTSINFAGSTSMEVGVRVESENPMTGDVRHTASAFLTYVALDKNGKPTEVPPLILETDEEKRRNKEARARRKNRLCGK